MVNELVSLLAIPYPNHQGKLSSTVPARPPNGCHWQEAGLALFLSCPGASSSTPTPPEPAPLLPIKVWGPDFQVLQPVRGYISSPALTPLGSSSVTPPLGPVLRCCPGEAQSQLSHYHFFRVLHPVRGGDCSCTASGHPRGPR